MSVIGILFVTAILAWGFNRARSSAEKRPSAIAEQNRSHGSDNSDCPVAFQGASPFRSVSTINSDRLTPM